MKMIKYALSRYAYFLSYVAAFLAGVAIVVPAVYMLIPLAAAVLLGSASSYYRRFGRSKNSRFSSVVDPDSIENNG